MQRLLHFYYGNRVIQLRSVCKLLTGLEAADKRQSAEERDAAARIVS
jgi:hypothetical protein